MTEQSFIRRRESLWQEFAALINGGRSELKRNTVPFLVKFREMTQDLNTAKAYGFDPAVIERLNTLVNEGNQILYASQGWPIKAFFRFILQTFPQKVRLQWRGILALALLFYGMHAFFFLLVIRFPAIAEELIPARQLLMYEDMYNPSSPLFLNPRGVSGDADMFGFYIYNNISIAFRTFASGILAGIGSILILCFNAGFLGIVMGHLINAGYAETLLPFIIAHGSFELNAIVFSAYAGMLLGYRFFVTGGLSRGASIKKAGQDALPIIAGSTLMLVIAAAIEAFWSSQHTLPITLRISTGIILWILLLLYFLLAGRKTEKTNT